MLVKFLVLLNRVLYYTTIHYKCPENHKYELHLLWTDVTLSIFPLKLGSLQRNSHQIHRIVNVLFIVKLYKSLSVSQACRMWL